MYPRGPTRWPVDHRWCFPPLTSPLAVPLLAIAPQPFPSIPDNDLLTNNPRSSGFSFSPSDTSNRRSSPRPYGRFPPRYSATLRSCVVGCPPLCPCILLFSVFISRVKRSSVEKVLHPFPSSVLPPLAFPNSFPPQLLGIPFLPGQRVDPFPASEEQVMLLCPLNLVLPLERTSNYTLTSSPYHVLGGFLGSVTYLL